MALSQGQLSYWRKRTGRPKLTLGQAAYQRAQRLQAPKASINPPHRAVVHPATPAPITPPRAQTDPPAGVVDQTMQPGNFQDAQYFTDVGKNTLSRNTQLAQMDQTASEDQTAYAEALRRFREQQPRQEETTVNQANKAGLLYSGTLGRELGDIRTNAIRQEADMRGAYDSRQRARQAARQALMDGGTLDDAAAAAAAVDRQIQRDTSAADSRSLVQESLIPPDAQDAGVDVGTPSPKRGGRQNTNRTPNYLPRGYANWDQKKRSRYWARRRKARK